MALLNLDEDPWILEYESCDKLHRDIMEQLTLRQNEPKFSEQYSKLSASIRLHLKQFNNETNQLKQKINIAAESHKITHDEVERRIRQVEVLLSKSVQMQRMFDDQIIGAYQDRTVLIGAAGSSLWGNNDDELIGSDPAQSIDQLKHHQKRMIEDQQEGLENLSKIISRQKNIAQTINQEVDLQNDIIDDLGDHIDRTDARVSNETRHIGTIDRKDKTCIYWVIIILLFISIITVAAI